MKKFIISLTLFAASFSACNYLDIVPDETATEKDAFKDIYAVRDYLYGCYSFMPKPYEYMIYMTGCELTYVKTGWGSVQLGTYSPTALGQFTFWQRYYGGIKRCWDLINNVDNVPRLSSALKEQYKAEAKFLVAYFHFQLMRAYGPIPILDRVYASDATDFPSRSSIDECVQWISDMYDEAYAGLLMPPANGDDPNYGRANKLAAKALKAKLWLYAASPLFNGNSEFYSNSLKDPETGDNLIPQTVDATKWTKTLEYARAAVQECEANGIALYMNTETSGVTEPQDPIQRRLRMTIADRETRELIWADTRSEGYYDMQHNGTPRNYTYSGNTWNMNSPTLETVKRFYTSRGLPIEEDPAFVSPAEYMAIGQYDGQPTAKLHLDREPRFYSWISFHNGWTEVKWKGDIWGNDDPEKGGDAGNYSRTRTMYRRNDPQGAALTKEATSGLRSSDFSNTGYLNKKLMHPNHEATSSSTVTFPYSIIRLADLYLIVAEAAVEANQLDVAKTYLNRVRERAGIPTVEESWQGVAELTQSKLREIVRREREIEMYLEAELMWDNKRWKTMHKLIPPGNGNPHGLDVTKADDAGFFTEVEVKMAWAFESPKHYLLPIPQKDVDIITNLIQNPGY